MYLMMLLTYVLSAIMLKQYHQLNICGESVKLTKDQKKYLSKVANLGCIICTRLGYAGTPSEIHHIRGLGLGMGVRNSHDNVIPLCPSHHRGNDGYHGMGRKAFERKYEVTETQLLEQVKEMLNDEEIESS
jgi:5-methylcytosine-specific restriction endonuclease McrA